MQAKTVSVGPVTAAVANQVAASQTPYAGRFIINGAGATYSANNVAAAQAVAGAGDLTLVSSPVSFSAARHIYVTSAGDDTGITFTIVGYSATGNYLRETLTGANAKSRVSVNRFLVVSSITSSGAAAGNVTVGSYLSAALGNASRQVTITPAADESLNTFTVAGTDANGETVTETIAGVANPNVATSVTYFATVTSVRLASDASGAITVGMSNTASSSWIRFDDFAPSNISIQCNVSGSATYTVQSTLDDPNAPVNPASAGAMNWVASSDTNVVTATTTQQSNFLFAPKFARVILTTTSTGSVRGTFLQSSNGPK